MSLERELKQFNESYLVANDGDIFAAVNQLADDSEKVKARTQGRLSSSEAISALLTKQLPEDTFKRKLVKDMERLYIERYIREALSQIDDVAVRYSVNATLQTSKTQKNLVFKYVDGLTPGQKSRVRVISKLVWYNLYPKGDSQDV